MAFEVNHKGPPGKRFLFMVRRWSDDHFWSTAAGWVPDPATAVNVMREQAPGYYSVWITNTAKGENYEVAVRLQAGPIVKGYTCDSRGKPAGPKGKPVNATFVSGTLHVDGVPQEPEVVYEVMSSNGVTKYTAIRWKPSQVTSCNCPGWTTNAKHKGKDIAGRSCKHTAAVKVMTRSVFLAGTAHLPAAPAPGNTERSGRGVELD
jgi:hypothetical protein